MLISSRYCKLRKTKVDFEKHGFWWNQKSLISNAKFCKLVFYNIFFYCLKKNFYFVKTQQFLRQSYIFMQAVNSTGFCL